MRGGGPYYGKYRGTVVNNIDPLLMGRIIATVTDVAGFIPLTWAMPCVPLAGINMGMLHVPPIGSGVWIEFERGDPDFPIWVGGFWGSAAETPSMAKPIPPGLPTITLQTPLLNGIVISDLPGPTGGIQIVAGLARISVSATGITMTNGMGATFTMAGPSIDMNAGALTVI